MSDSIGLSRLKENSKKEIQNLCKILLQLLNNILGYPDQSKYRKLFLHSELIAEKLMPFSGGLEILFEIGFQEGEDYMFLPDNFDREIVSKKYDLLKRIEDENSDKICTPYSASICASTIVSERAEFGLKNLKNLTFANRLNQSFNHVMIYEDHDLRNKCLQKIPATKLQSSARAKYLSYTENNQEIAPYDERDFLILELLDWFKNEFFRWTNQPDCPSCNSNKNMIFLKNDKPNFNEATWNASNVEVYK